MCSTMSSNDCKRLRNACACHVPAPRIHEAALRPLPERQRSLHRPRPRCWLSRYRSEKLRPANWQNARAPAACLVSAAHGQQASQMLMRNGVHENDRRQSIIAATYRRTSSDRSGFRPSQASVLSMTRAQQNGSLRHICCEWKSMKSDRRRSRQGAGKVAVKGTLTIVARGPESGRTAHLEALQLTLLPVPAPSSGLYCCM